MTSSADAAEESSTTYLPSSIWTSAGPCGTEKTTMSLEPALSPRSMSLPDPTATTSTKEPSGTSFTLLMGFMRTTQR
ncbi:MAG: hypothetical protein RXP97_06520 [Nitrososphaeria archaeon]|jgi:hypothetical protein